MKTSCIYDALRGLEAATNSAGVYRQRADEVLQSAVAHLAIELATKFNPGVETLARYLTFSQMGFIQGLRTIAEVLTGARYSAENIIWQCNAEEVRIRVQHSPETGIEVSLIIPLEASDLTVSAAMAYAQKIGKVMGITVPITRQH